MPSYCRDPRFQGDDGLSEARDFLTREREKASDQDLKGILRRTLTNHHLAVERNEAHWIDWQVARSLAASWKHDAISRLDSLLEELETNLTARGTVVHWASNADEALDIIDTVVRENGVQSVIKGKSMTTEEIGLNEHLEAGAVEVVESDLGEFIIQLRGEKPFHIITPAMHLTKSDISALFEEKLDVPHTDDAETLTRAARAHMRSRFLQADMGITGANFAIANPGLISITENEGNGILSASAPRIHLAIMGIEKVLPQLEQLALFLPLLSHSGTGQFLSCYNSFFGGPRQTGERDGPEQFHLVLLDNGRTGILADPEQRESLQCIRCGACLNACPIFRNIGGHAYGVTYQGPIGSVISPNLLGVKEFGHLSFASSLCGKCAEVCPVRINIHHHLLENRRNLVKISPPSTLERHGFRGYSRTMVSATRYRMAVRFARLGLGMIQRVPFLKRFGPIQKWTASRTLPVPARTSFLEQVAEERKS